VYIFSGNSGILFSWHQGHNGRRLGQWNWSMGEDWGSEIEV